MKANKKGLPLAPFSELCELDRAAVRTMKHRGYLMLPSYRASAKDGVGRHRYQYDDALTVEIAKQLHQDGGPSLRDALCLVSAAGAAESFLNYLAKCDDAANAPDYWIGSARYLTTGCTSCHVPVCGTLDEVICHLRIKGDSAHLTRFDFVNVTSANDSLSWRATKMGYVHRNGVFVGSY